MDPEDVQHHEYTCALNTDLKKCWTCKHNHNINKDKDYFVSKQMYVCQVDIVFDEKVEAAMKGGCKKWEQEND